MSKIKALLHEELSGWKPFDIIWLILVCVSITVITILTSNSAAFQNPDNTLTPQAARICSTLSIIAAITGVINVVLGGKGKLSNYFFGFINCILMIFINFTVKNYGIMMVGIYNLVMQFVGFAMWSKNMNKETHEVKKIHMKVWQRCMWTAILGVSTLALGFAMSHLKGEKMPYLDAFITASQIVAMILMVSMFAEQWWLWILINIASIYLFFTTKEVTFALSLMYIVYFANSIVMCIRWEKEARQNDRQADILLKTQNNQEDER